MLTSGPPASYDPGYINTQTAIASSAASLSFTGLDTNSYKSWRLECRDITPVNATTVGLQVGEGSTPTWETGSSYAYNAIYSASGGTPAASTSTTGGAILVSPDNLDNSQGEPSMWSVDLSDLAYGTSTTHKTMKWTFGYYKSGVGMATSNGAGYWGGDTNSITAVRLIATSGNIVGSCTLTGRP